MADKIYGVLRRRESGEFVYYCSDCKECYKSGFELEQHILLDHEPDDEQKYNELDDVVPIADVQKVKIEPPPKLEANCFDAVESKESDSENGNFSNGDNEHNDDDGEIDNNENKPCTITVRAAHSSSFVCESCDKNFKTKNLLNGHMKSMHGNTSKSLCSICGGEFIDIDIHMRTHRNVKKSEKSYFCKVCNAKFRHSSYLNIHMRVHTGEAPYMCYICGRTFISQGKLTHHTKRHSDVKQHQCDQCDRAYHDRYQLKKHVNIVHKGIRLFSCTLCETSKFTTKKSLGQHMLLHGEKRYQCKFCDQKFAQGSGRRGHEKRVHGAI